MSRTRFFLNVVGKTVSLTIAFLFVIFAPNDQLKIVAFVVGVGIIFLAEYLAAFRPTKDWDKIRREQLNYFFERFAQSAELDGSPVEIRINVMLKQWRWNGRRLVQFYQYGMSGYPDANLEFSIRRGLCGHVLRSQIQDVTYKSKAQLDAERYGLSDKELALVKHVTAIAAIPVFRDVETFYGNPKQQYFGVVNVDAVDTKGAQLLAEPSIHEQIVGLAAFVQITLG